MKKIYSIFLIFLMLTMFICKPVHAASKKDSRYSKKIFTEYSFKIPNLNTNFVPQGLCATTYKGTHYKLITAYDYTNAQRSRIYIINSKRKTY